MRKRFRPELWHKARTIARQLMIDCGGNAEMAKSMARERAEDYGISPLAILAVVRLIIMLIEWWYSSGVSDPPEQPMFGEPGLNEEWVEMGDVEFEEPGGAT